MLRHQRLRSWRAIIAYVTKRRRQEAQQERAVCCLVRRSWARCRTVRSAGPPAVHPLSSAPESSSVSFISTSVVFQKSHVGRQPLPEAGSRQERAGSGSSRLWGGGRREAAPTEGPEHC